MMMCYCKIYDFSSEGAAVTAWQISMFCHELQLTYGYGLDPASEPMGLERLLT